jgi:hypothetical protein
MHCVINIQDEKDHPTIQCTAPQCSSVYGEDSYEWLGTCPLSPYSVDLAPSDYNLLMVIKDQISSQHYATSKPSTVIYELLKHYVTGKLYIVIYEIVTDFYCKVIFKLLE